LGLPASLAPSSRQASLPKRRRRRLAPPSRRSPASGFRQANAVFGREQSFVAGDPTNVQISVKDSRRYPQTNGWGYGQFEKGKPNPSASVANSCFACHSKLPPARDLVFTNYAK
jgi:hypothetical protein